MSEPTTSQRMLAQNLAKTAGSFQVACGLTPEDTRAATHILAAEVACLTLQSEKDFLDCCRQAYRDIERRVMGAAR